MDRIHLEPGQPASGPDPVYIARQLAGILADHHELQARTYRLMQLSLTTSAVNITGPAGLPQMPETGELAERIQKLVATLDALPAAAAPPAPPAAPAIVPPRPADLPTPYPPKPANPPPAPPVQAVADEASPAPRASDPVPELPPHQEGARSVVVASTPAQPDKRQQIFEAWATTTDTANQIADSLGFKRTTVSASISTGRQAGHPKVLAGDAARREAEAKAYEDRYQAEKAAVAALPTAKAVDTAATRRDRVLDSYQKDPAKLLVLSARLNVPVPDLSGILLAARQAGDQRVLDGDTKMREANAVARRQPDPTEPMRPAGALNPVQIRAQAQLRNKVLDHYGATGDHPNVVARKLGVTLREVEDFIEDAGRADERVKLGNIRRAKQVRGGK